MSRAQAGSSLRAYASHRKQAGLSGGSAAAVSKAVLRGRLKHSVVVVDGTPRIVDFAVADQEWAERSDYSRAPQRLVPQSREPSWLVTRRKRARPITLDPRNRIAMAELVALLRVDEAGISALLPKGLGAAVVQWDPMLFDRLLALWFYDAWNCPTMKAVGKCLDCFDVVFSAEADAEHQVSEQHGIGDCDDCQLPDWPMVQPCGLRN
jgi:hypothetical protein